MKKYPIKLQNMDFKLLEINPNVKGSRIKEIVIDKNGEKAFLNIKEIII